MRPSAVFEKNRAVIQALTAKYQCANPRIFGSVLKGTDTESSDIDLLVDPLPKTTLFHLGGLLDELETLLGVPVHLLTPGDISIKFRAKVLAEAVAV